MARIIRRPMAAIDWGDINNTGTGNVLGDADNATYKFIPANAGSILVFPEMTQAQMPAQPVVAVMVGFDQSNGGFVGRYNGWVCGYMRIDGTRDPSTKAYVQDGYSTNTRSVVGPPLYKADAEAFTVADIDSISMDVGAAVGPIGPDTSKRWCIAREAYLILVTAEAVPVPTLVYPANASTVNTSSINFTATLPGYEVAQPTRAVFEVARDSAFTTEVSTFVSDYALSSGAASYTSVPGQDSYTDLGPGTWYVRTRGRDFRGQESAWSATRSFSISHPVLPQPTVATTGTVQTPYHVRSANIPSSALGGRRVGVQWRFSKSSTFASGVITWSNVTGGIFTTGIVSYDPQPDASILPGLNGYKVSYDDPSQYLSQGLWYAQARTIDRWGQVSAWSTSTSFTVSHPPTSGGYSPTGGAKFDPETSEVSWSFSDPWPGDRQGSYVVNVYDSTLSTIWTSGVIQSPLSRARLAIPVNRFGQTLSWDVTVTDIDGVTAPPSPRQSFVYSRSPQITITSPGATVISGQPQFSWSTVFAGAGITQYSWRVSVSEVGQAAVVFNTGTMISTATSVTPPQPILADGKLYDVRVWVTDTNGLTGLTILRVMSQFVRPPQVPVAVSSGDYATEGYVNAFWSRGPDPMFVEWRLYRRLAGLDTWTLATTSTDPLARSLRDWLAGGTDIEYAMTQVASRDGSLVESAPVTPPPAIRLSSSSYLLVVPAIDFAVRVRPAGDSFSMARESHSMQIIGRGAKVNFGTGRTVEGSLSIPLRDPYTARLDRMSIESLIGSEHEVWLRTPFGDAFRVALGEYSFERLPGVGTADLGDLEIPYTEVMQ